MKENIKCGHVVNDTYPSCVTVHMRAIDGATRSDVDIHVTMCVICAAQTINLFNILEKIKDAIPGIINIHRPEKY